MGRLLPVVLVPLLMVAACSSEPASPAAPEDSGIAPIDAGPIDAARKPPARDASVDAAPPTPAFDAAPRPRERCDLSVGDAFTILPGHYYDEHVVVSVDSLGAPPGRYTFTGCEQIGATWVQVDLVRDGVRINRFDIPTYNIIGECRGPDNTTKLTFPGFFAFEMAAFWGSRNLNGICETIFDGKRAYSVL